MKYISSLSDLSLGLYSQKESGKMNQLSASISAEPLLSGPLGAVTIRLDKRKFGNRTGLYGVERVCLRLDK